MENEDFVKKSKPREDQIRDEKKDVTHISEVINQIQINWKEIDQEKTLILEYQDGENIEKKLLNKKPTIPLYLLDSCLACLEIIKQEEEKLKRENLIQDLIYQKIPSKKEEKEEFPKVFSKMFFSSFDIQQRLIKIEQQMNFQYRTENRKIDMNYLKRKQKREYEKFVRDLYSVYKNDQEQDSRNQMISYAKIQNCKTFEINLKLPDDIKEELSRSTLEMFGLKNDDYKINIFFCFDQTTSGTLTSYDKENDVLEIFQRTRNISQLYSNDLNAMIIDCYIEKDFEISWGQGDFKKTIEEISLPDLHFESFEDQLEIIKGEFKNINHIPQTGEFFITKHSNLCWIHTIFHLISEQKDYESVKNDLKNGLKEVLLKCASFGVTNLSIQLPFKEELSKNQNQDILSQIQDFMVALNLSYGKSRVKNFKNIYIYLPGHKNDKKLELFSKEKNILEKILSKCLGFENVNQTKMSPY